MPELVMSPPADTGLADRVFRNVVALIGGRGAGLVLSGAASILLARYLGKGLLGEYGAIYAYLALYGWIATFGLESILAREAAKDRQRAGSILLTGVVVCAAFSVVATVLALALAPRFGIEGRLRLLLIFAAVDILILAPLRLPAIVFNVDLRQWYGVGIGLFRQGLWLAVLVLLAALKADFMWIIIGRAVCALAEAVLTLILTYHRGLLVRPWRFLSGPARAYVSYGFPIAVSTLAIGVYHRIDQVMLHKMSTDQVLGGYVAAVNITELFSVVPVALMSSLFPVLSQLAAEDARFFHYLRISFRSMMAVAFGACAVVSPLATPIVHLLYGAKFAASGPLLAVLIWSEVPVFFGVVMTNGLIARNLQKFLPLSTCVGAAVNILLNLWLIPRWGALGASWATNISYTLAGVFLFFVFRSTRAMAWTGCRISLAPLLLTLFIAAVFTILRVPALLELPLIIGIYGLGAWATGIVQRREIDRVVALVGSLSRWAANAA